jgi:hypothetical protein
MPSYRPHSSTTCPRPPSRSASDWRERLSLRRQEHHCGRVPARRADVLDRSQQRLGLHHHPRSATIRHIVNAAMPIGGELAKIVDLHVQQPALDSPADHAFRDAASIIRGKIVTMSNLMFRRS